MFESRYVYVYVQMSLFRNGKVKLRSLKVCCLLISETV
jgi:hypothetical protein